MRSAERFSNAIIPNLVNSQFHYHSVLETNVKDGERWLDVGCGHDIIPAWIPGSREWQQSMAKRALLLVGIDADYPSIAVHGQLKHKVVGTVHPLPFQDASFSLITLNMVAEHLSDPEPAFREFHRVLRNNGRLIFHTPNKLSYRVLSASMIPQSIKLKLIKFFEARDSHDVFPTFYSVNTKPRIEAIARGAGFEVEEIRFEETTPVASALGPLVLPEILFLRILRFEIFNKFRGDIIAILRKPEHTITDSKNGSGFSMKVA